MSAGITGDTPADRVESFKAARRVFFWEPWPWQQRLLRTVREKSTTAAISSNKIGKTAALVCIMLSWIYGYEPWTMGYEGADAVVDEGGWRYRPSTLGISPPVSLILTGEDWKLHIGRVLVPEFKKWAPAGEYETKRNEQGVEYFWEFGNGSTLTLMSYSQDDDLFESFRAQGVAMDEPPPKSKYAAMSRGLLLDRGKTLLSLTPLKEAWILDEIVLSGRRDIGIVSGMDIRDNPVLYEGDLAVLEGMGLDQLQRMRFFDLLLYDDLEKKTPVSDRGLRAIKYLEKSVADEALSKMDDLKILKFIQDIDPPDVPPRVFGQFKSLVGRVLKEFEMSTHVVKPFDVPTDWPVTVMIDFHLSTPQAVSYWAVNPQGIHYCVGETWKNMSASEIADDVIRRVRMHGWSIERAFIDPLSKGDTEYMRNALGTNVRDTYTILNEKLGEHGIWLAVASKDKEAGIHNIREWLRGPNGLPTVYVFDDCERHLHEVQRWVYDDDGKPAKENDHFMENWYRYTLTGAHYEARRPDRDYTDRRSALGSSAWMAA